MEFLEIIDTLKSYGGIFAIMLLAIICIAGSGHDGIVFMKFIGKILAALNSFKGISAITILAIVWIVVIGDDGIVFMEFIERIFAALNSFGGVSAITILATIYMIGRGIHKNNEEQLSGNVPMEEEKNIYGEKYQGKKDR